jgi:hypothetical protein
MTVPTIPATSSFLRLMAVSFMLVGGSESIVLTQCFRSMT